MKKKSNTLSLNNILATPVICPNCLKERIVSNTPLPNYFQYILKKELTALDNAELIRLKEWITELSKIYKKNKSDFIYHTRLWACNNCLHKKKSNVIMPHYDKQNYGIGGPIITYIDIEYECQTCRKPFTFYAKEQKYWYEELKFFIEAKPVNCPECRRIIRKQKESNKRLGELLKIQNPDINTLKDIYNTYCELEHADKAEIILKRIRNVEKNQISLKLDVKV